MRKPSIDYSKYSQEDLESALAGIDRERYPENYQALLQALKAAQPLNDPSGPPPVQVLLRSGDSRIEKPTPMPSGYARFERPDGSILLQQRHDLLAAIPFAIVLIVVTLASNHKEGAFTSLQISLSILFLVLTAILSISRRSVILDRQRLEVRYGIGKCFVSKTQLRPDIRYVRFENSPSSDGDTFTLVIGSRPERELRFSGEKDASLWLGWEIAVWAGVPFLKSRQGGWNIFKWGSD